MKKHITQISITFLLLIGGVFAAYAFHSMTATVESEIGTLNQEADTLSIQASRVTTLRQVVNSSGDELQTVNQYFVPKDGALDFVKYIENLAVSSGLTFKINVFDSEQNDALSKNDKEFLKTSLNTTGSLKNTRNFMSLVETLPYNVKVTRIDMRRSAGGTFSTVRDEWSTTIDFSVVKIMDK